MFLLPNKSGDTTIYKCVHETALTLVHSITANPTSLYTENVESQTTLKSYADSLVKKRFFETLRLALTSWIIDSLEVAIIFIFLGLCLWCTSFKNSAGFFQSQKFHTKICEIKDFKYWLWLVAILNPAPKLKLTIPLIPLTSIQHTIIHTQKCTHTVSYKTGTMFLISYPTFFFIPVKVCIFINCRG